MTARYWRGQDPIDRRLQVKGRWVRVIGVAADSKYESMRESPTPFFYVPLLQDFVRGPALNIRTTPASAEHFGCPTSRSARTGPEPCPLRDDYASGTG
jgi:hypothetical protein